VPTIETRSIEGLTVRVCVPREIKFRPVLLVHGYFAQAAMFDEWLSLLARRGFPAYAVNLRGRGGSRPGTDIGRASMADFADDVVAVARVLGKPYVIGHSMGGLLAQMAAERGVVHAMALICPAPPRGILLFTVRLALMQLKYLWPILRSRPVDPSVEDLRILVFNHVPADAQSRFLEMFVADSGRAGRDMSLNAVTVDKTLVTCPTLVFTADDDRFIPSRIVAKIAARYGAPLRVARGHGHMLPVEPGWQETAELVAEWLTTT
jgi:pimeloyl-ACP methyl ester carboxylesterase